MMWLSFDVQMKLFQMKLFFSCEVGGGSALKRTPFAQDTALPLTHGKNPLL